MTEIKKDYPVIYEIEDLYHLIREKDEDEYDADSETEKEDDVEDQESSDDDEENPSDDEQEGDAESDDQEDLGETVPADTYKGLQRTVSKKDKEIKDLEGKLKAAEKEKADAEAMLNSGEKVRLDLQKTITDQGKRLSALEQENEQSKTDAMQNRVIAEDFPQLAKLKAYIPSAASEDEYRKNCEGLVTALGEETTKLLTKEVSTSTPPVEDDEKPVSQAQVDKLYDKAVALAGVKGKEKEYNKAYDEYLAALNSRQ